MKFVRKLLGQTSQVDQLEVAEELDLSSRIKEAMDNLEHAWQNFRFAQPEYIDIAIMEIHNAENEYSLLTRKLRLLKSTGQESNLDVFGSNPRSQFLWLHHRKAVN